MLKIATALFVFLGGFAVMVLEIIGQRYLAKDFGGAFYTWISQIGVILTALALGYAIGGTLADRFQRAGFLAVPMAVARTSTPRTGFRRGSPTRLARSSGFRPTWICATGSV